MQEGHAILDKAHKENPRTPHVGIEIELENALHSPKYVADVNYSITDTGWLSHEDGSLRNHGIEFVTRLGVNVAMVPTLTKAFEKYIVEWTAGRAQANARTGLHVHIDVSALSAPQLCNFLFLYAILEPVFFRVSGNRSDSIFCVPWEFGRKSLGEVLVDLSASAKVGYRNWRWRNYTKYCGLNISTIETYGTVEFRMHSGTYKAEAINKWVDCIHRLYMYVKNTDVVENINRFRMHRFDYKYWDLIGRIFQEYMPVLEPERAEMIARCKVATISVFKAFVDKAKIADTTVKRKQPQPRLDIDFGANIWAQAVVGQAPMPRMEDLPIPDLAGVVHDEFEDFDRNDREDENF
jgi:hypothetical protein